MSQFGPPKIVSSYFQPNELAMECIYLISTLEQRGSSSRTSDLLSFITDATSADIEKELLKIEKYLDQESKGAQVWRDSQGGWHHNIPLAATADENVDSKTDSVEYFTWGKQLATSFNAVDL